jgi:two-component system cell cycle response regulator
VKPLTSRPPLSLDTLPPPGSELRGGRLLVLQSSLHRERVLLTALSSPEVEVIVADPGVSVSLLIEQTAADVLLLDRAIADFDAICRGLKLGASRTFPIVVIDWDDGGEAAAVEALEAGADEFASAPGRLHELRARVQNQLRHKRRLDIFRRLRAERDSLRTDVRLDALTQVLNRKALDRALAELEADDAELSVVFLDVDHFKSINDTFGHSAGDRALAALGRLLVDQLRPNDVVGRYGGEEFLIVLRDAGGDVARRVAERIRQSLAETPVSGIARGITVSAGVACRAQGETVSNLVARADFALYSAKRDGRDRVTTAPPAPALESSAASSVLPADGFVTGMRAVLGHPGGICAAE